MNRLWLLTEVGYRMWLYGPVLVIVLMMISRPIEEKAEVDHTSVDSVAKAGLSFTIPFYIGVVVPLGFLLSLIAGSLWLRSEASDKVFIGMFIVSQVYMIAPATVFLKTAYGVLVIMPAMALVMVYLLYRLRLPLKPMLYLASGVAILTGSACFLVMVANDKFFNRIGGALAMYIVGAVLLEMGYYYHKPSRHLKTTDDEEPLLSS